MDSTIVPWHQGRMYGFDLETTCADPEQARIVQAAVVIVGGGQDTTVRTWLVNPGVEIPEEAAAIHGVSTERAQAEGQDAAAAIAEIIDALAARPAGAPIVIFNARYDLTVLDREARRYGITPLSERGDLLVIDPFVIDRFLWRYRKGSRKLEAMCEQYGARLEDAHQAHSDAIAAARIAWVFGERGRVVRRAPRDPWEAEEIEQVHRQWAEVRGDLRKLHAAQQEWAAKQADGLREHFRRKGIDEPVPGDWPLIPHDRVSVDADVAHAQTAAETDSAVVDGAVV